jgi:hypothetical protein
VLALNAQNLKFDSLALGALDGQDGWSDSSGLASVAADPTGGTSDFSGNVLSLDGSVSTPMNSFASKAFSGTLSNTISMDLWIAPGVPTDPAELFLRLNSWGNYIAIKADTGILEVTGGSLTGLTIPTSTVFNLTAVYDVTGGTASEVEFFIDGASQGSVTGLSTGFTASNFEFRSQKVQAFVDNVVVPEPSAYSIIAGALALGFVLNRRRK